MTAEYVPLEPQPSSVTMSEKKQAPAHYLLTHTHTHATTDAWPEGIGRTWLHLHLEHVPGVLRWTTVDREGVLLLVGRPPVRHMHLVGSFHLPVLDEVLDQCLEGAGLVPRALLCRAGFSLEGSAPERFGLGGGRIPLAHICLVAV